MLVCLHARQRHLTACLFFCSCGVSCNLAVGSGQHGRRCVPPFEQHSHLHHIFFTHPSIPSHLHCCKFPFFKRLNISQYFKGMLDFLKKVLPDMILHISPTLVWIQFTLLQGILFYNPLAGMLNQLFKGGMLYEGISSYRRTQRTIRKGDGRQTVKLVRWETHLCRVSS